MHLLIDELKSDPMTLEIVRLSVISFDSHACQIVPLTQLADLAITGLKADEAPGCALGAALNLLSDCIGSDHLVRTASYFTGRKKPQLLSMKPASR